MAVNLLARASVIPRFFSSHVLPSVCSQCLRRQLQYNSHKPFERIRPTLAVPSMKFCSTKVSTVPDSKLSTEVEDLDEPDELYKRIILEIKGHDPTVLKSYWKFLDMVIKELDITLESIEIPRRYIKRYTLLKSVHIYKKHRVQYETRTYYRVVKDEWNTGLVCPGRIHRVHDEEIRNLTGSTASTFLEYIQRNLPEGVAMKVTKEQVESIPDHLQKPPSDADIAATS